MGDRGKAEELVGLGDLISGLSDHQWPVSSLAGIGWIRKVWVAVWLLVRRCGQWCKLGWGLITPSQHLGFTKTWFQVCEMSYPWLWLSHPIYIYPPLALSSLSLSLFGGGGKSWRGRYAQPFWSWFTREQPTFAPFFPRGWGGIRILLVGRFFSILQFTNVDFASRQVTSLLDFDCGNKAASVMW